MTDADKLTRLSRQPYGGRMQVRPLLIAALALSLLTTALVLNASRPGSRVAGCLQGCATATRRQPGPLRVISLNMLHGFPRFQHLGDRLDLIAQEIQRQDADIVLLQEVPWTLRLGNGAAYLARRTGLNDAFLRANGNRWAILFEEGEAILSRFPLHDVAFVELKPRAGFFEHRVALRATAITPWGDLTLYVTHLTNGAAAVNRQQAASLLAFVEGAGRIPALVAGDFNAVESSPQIQQLAEQWIDTYRAVNPEDPGPTCCVEVLSTDPNQRPRKRIDYIFLVSEPGQAVQVIKSRRLLTRPVAVADGWLWASDHSGLLTILALSGDHGGVQCYHSVPPVAKTRDCFYNEFIRGNGSFSGTNRLTLAGLARSDIKCPTYQTTPDQSG